MNLRRALVALVILSGAAIGSASPAHGGGSTWDVEPEAAMPGQQVTAGTCVAWAHNDDLGTPEDGPYSMWISPIAANETIGGSSVAGVPDGAVPVGQITIDEGGLWKNCGPNAARITFTVPDLAPGEYELIHCNDPCTDVLGDITWGVMTVAAADGSVPTPAPPSTSSTTGSSSTTTSAPTTTPPTTTAPAEEAASPLGEPGSSDGSGDGSSGIVAGLAGAAIAAVVVAGWAVVRES